MKYCGLDKNDTAAAPGFSVTLYVSGCDKHCPGCHNPETWSFDYGQEMTWSVYREIVNELCSSPVQKNLCIMGGEPLHFKNMYDVRILIEIVKNTCPNTPIYIWTGYTFEELQEYRRKWHNENFDFIINNIDYLIDGPYKQEERDITLAMRGSRNQRIINLKNGEIISIIK